MVKCHKCNKYFLRDLAICVTPSLLWFIKYFKNTAFRKSHSNLQKHSSVIIPAQLDNRPMPHVVVLVSYQEEDKLSSGGACSARYTVMSSPLKSSNLL